MHRFNPTAHYVIGLMNGYRTVNEIWESAIAKFADDAPTQEEVIRLLGQLHSAEVLQSEVTPDIAELLRRAKKSQRKTWYQNLLSPLAIRIPLFDPDRWLERWLPWFRPYFGVMGAMVWLLVVGFALFTAAAHWQELSQDLGDRVLAPQNLVLLWLTFPVLKLFHEFGHACATKAWGGEVHEMGIMLLVLMPVPYVDASSASAFRETHRRAIVGAAGMIVEVFIASLALFLWLEVEPGIIRAVLYNIMLIAGVSTLIFNGNPLLRYDGYYILADITQIPNLRMRAQQYLGYLLETRFFGLKLPPFEASLSERWWFVFFAIASFLYRTFVMVAIAIFIASTYMVVGVVLALWAMVTGVIFPLVKAMVYLVRHPRLRRHRVRALFASGTLAVTLVVLLCFLPLPLWTRAEGVIWVPDDAQVRAGADGFVRTIAADPGSLVRQGSVLIVADDPTLLPKMRVLEAQLHLLEVRAQAESIVDRPRWQRTQDEMSATAVELEQARTLVRDLTVLSPTSGTFVLPAARDLPDRFVRKGQQIGYVVPAAVVTARVLVSQDQVDLVRTRTERVNVKLAGRVYETFTASIRRESPAATNKLANLAMSSIGGGQAVVDPHESKEPKMLNTWFEFELELPATQAFVLGEHVYVRFEHGSEPVAWRLYRTVRQLFMKRFSV